jgi:succinyl-diaminopimelate desuccinylase
LEFDLQWELSGEPFLTKQGPLVTATVESIREMTSLNPTLSTGGGTSDGRFIAPTGAEVVELGPCNQTVHQINERVRMEDVYKLTGIYYRILTKLFYPES